jgi:hypothetical protein
MRSHRLKKKNTTTPTIPPAVVDSSVWMKLRPILKANAGANKNLILLTANTISILKNPDKAICFYM